jgi:pimeloyl-ACP methyl ester carboxylesterase
MNALAQAGNRVYAIDLLGFGASDKPLLDYDSDIWVAQCASFLREVAGCGQPVDGDNNSTLRRRAVVAGNSIGGLTALALAAAEPSLVRGVATLNCAGRFSPTPAERVQAQMRKPVPQAGFATAWSGTFDLVGAALRRVLLGGAFVITKQPARISQVCLHARAAARARS